MSSVRELVLVLAALTVVSTGAAAATNLTASSIEGEGPLAVEAENATALFRGDRIAIPPTLEAERITLTVVEDRVRSYGESPTGATLVAQHERNRTVESYDRSVLLTVEEILDANATVLALPTEGKAAMQTSVVQEGHYTAEPIDDRLLESSHVVDENRSGPYYEYTAEDTIEFDSDGPTRVAVNGSFQVYLWGMGFRVLDEDQTDTYRTGHEQTDNGAGTGAYEEETYTFAVAQVRDGRIQLGADGRASEDLALFADVLRADPDGSATTSFANASGTLEGEEDRRAGSGDTLTSRDGEFTWRYEDGESLQASSTDDPVEVSGGESAQPAVALAAQALASPTSGLLVAALAAGLLVAPNALGRRSPENQPRGSPSGEPRRWRVHRAKGYRWLASRVARWGFHRWGLRLFHRAYRQMPRNPWYLRSKALWLRTVGEPDKALRFHRLAHDEYRLDGRWIEGRTRVQSLHELDDWSLDAEGCYNAYEAARTAVRLDQFSEAVAWLKLATMYEPRLKGAVAREEEFTPLWQFDRFHACIPEDARGPPGGDS